MQMRRGRDGVKSARQIIEALAPPSDVQGGARMACERPRDRLQSARKGVKAGSLDHNDGMVAEIADILPRAG